MRVWGDGGQVGVLKGEVGRVRAGGQEGSDDEERV
jgi:hypothetical protein